MTLQTLHCIPLSAVLPEHAFTSESSAHLICPAIIVSGERVPKDKFKSTNVVWSVWSGLLCHQRSRSSRASSSVLSEGRQVFILLSQERCTLLSVFWGKYFYSQEDVGIPERQGMGAAEALPFIQPWLRLFQGSDWILLFTGLKANRDA